MDDLISDCKERVVKLYIWNLTITEPEGFNYVFQAENDGGCCFMIEDNDVVSGSNRIINLVLCDCTNPVIYVSDLTGNNDMIESVMKNRQVSYQMV